MNVKLIKTIVVLIIYSTLATATWDGCGGKPSKSAKRKLEFIGRVRSFQDDLLNDRLIILYLNGKEVGRDITHTSKYYTDDVPNDGLFQIEVPNEYELSEKEIAERKYNTGIISTWKRIFKGHWGAVTFIDAGTPYEGITKEFIFPNRNNLKYSVKVMYSDFGALPREIRECEYTILSENGDISCPFGSNGPDSTNLSLANIEDIKLKDVEIPLDNCGGNSQINQRYFESEKYTHEFNFSAGIDAGIFRRIQARLGITDKQESEQTIESNFIAKARNKVIYTITWYEVWQHGSITYKTERGVKAIPFKVKAKLRYEIKSKNVSCR